MHKIVVYKLIEDFYRENYTKFVNITRGRAGSHHNAEDVVQEAFTRALQYHRSFNPAITSFDTWFSRILQNSLRNQNQDRRAQGMVYDTRTDGLATHTPNAYLQRFLTEIKTDIAALDVRKQEVMNLSFFMGYTTTDISRIVNMSVGAVRTMIHRFREELRLKYGKGVHS